MVRPVRYTLPVLALNAQAKTAMSVAHTSVVQRASRSSASSDGVLRKKLWMMSATVEFDMEFSAEDSEPIAAPRMPATSRPETTTGSPCRMNSG